MSSVVATIGHERVEQAARERVAYALADDETKIEEAVTEDGVCERRRHGQENDRQQGQDRVSEDVRSFLQPIHQEERHAGRDPIAMPPSENPDASAIGDALCPPVVIHQQQGDGRAGGEKARWCTSTFAGRARRRAGPGRARQMKAFVKHPRSGQCGGQQREDERRLPEETPGEYREERGTGEGPNV